MVSLEHVQLMRFHEEALAQSARNYAFTKDQKWQKRYESIKPEADNLLRFAATQSKKNKKFFTDMVYANIKCIEFEEWAIRLVNKGRHEEAIKILDGRDYNLFRKLLQGELENFALVKQKSPNHKLNVISTSLNELFNNEKILSPTDEEIAKEKFKAVGELATRVAHDIRNPLSTIKNIIDILESDDQDHSNQRYFKILRDNIDRIVYLIEDVLSFAKPKNLIIKKCSLNAIINNVINLAAQHNNIQIITQLADLEIECDQQKVETAICNIITNAIQSIGNEEGKIVIETICEGKKVTIKIQNSGLDIPEENLGRIFEPLFTTKQTGTGLGLVSVKNIVEQHRGTITVKNNPVTFTITLPKQFESFAYNNMDDSTNAMSRIIIGQSPNLSA